ncbi:hypothetical protein AALP_AA3G260400 [Arabis alpina]|uniref:CRC domain-containing protein n=1 Tax=Arabis alpina TaxID=50452 RepID=A0A087HBR1_ARAAL|nr:hypothetical protein AALP_AA3G260400 [Arabis alpina]
MDTPQKTLTQTGFPVSKLKVENSPVFNYINSLSPIKTVKSISIGQTLSSLSFSSPPSVFTSPHAASHSESCFRSHNDSSNPSKDDSISNKKEALVGIERSQYMLKNDTTPKVVNDTGENGSCEDGGMDMQKMCCDNVKAKSETPDWETLIAESEMFINGSPNDSEAFRCLMQRTSNSETRFSGGPISTLEDANPSVGANNDSEASDALSILHHGVRRRCLDVEIPGNNTQTLGESSSICVAPSIGQRVEEGPKSSALLELNQNIPKKKRRKFEQGGEGESSCKRCNCKKSKCLKLYCECFAAGVYCIEPCSCVDCFNKPIHKDVVLATRKQIESRNPLAFAPKVIRNSDSIMEVGDDESKTPASARHKRGCNCKKSNCLKKYCECYQSGIGCSINCRCEGCKNSFGRKNGSFGGLDIEQNEENETSGKTGTTQTQHDVELFNPAPPSTPMSLREPLAQLPISSNNILHPQQSHHLHGAFGSF